MAEVKRSSLYRIRFERSAIAVDRSGNPHIAYQTPKYHLKHAWRDGKRWRRATVDATSDSGWGNSLAIDSQGRVHVAYQARRDPSHSVLGYALIDKGGTQISDVDDGGVTSAIAVDSNDVPRVLYYDVIGFMLRYARLGPSGWETEDTGLSGLYFFPTSLALDSSGAAHIAYTQRTQGGDDIATYATNASGSWQATALVTQFGGNLSTSLALDSQDRPRVAVTVGGTVRYFTFDGTVWQSEDLFEASGEIFPGSVALALDSGDHPYVLFSGSVPVPGTEQDVEVTLYAFKSGAEWIGELVDHRDAGFAVAAALDGNGVLHGTYRKALRGEVARLKYARIILPSAGLAGPPAVTSAQNTARDR